MIPTAYLRLVKRTQFITMGDFSHVQKVVEGLQQWWISESMGEMAMRESNPTDTPKRGEWRDVELVNES